MKMKKINWDGEALEASKPKRGRPKKVEKRGRGRPRKTPQIVTKKEMKAWKKNSVDVTDRYKSPSDTLEVENKQLKMKIELLEGKLNKKKERVKDLLRDNTCEADQKKIEKLKEELKKERERCSVLQKLNIISKNNNTTLMRMLSDKNKEIARIKEKGLKEYGTEEYFKLEKVLCDTDHKLTETEINLKMAEQRLRQAEERLAKSDAIDKKHIDRLSDCIDNSKDVPETETTSKKSPVLSISFHCTDKNFIDAEIGSFLRKFLKEQNIIKMDCTRYEKECKILPNVNCSGCRFYTPRKK